MEKLIVHSTRMRSLDPGMDNVAVQIGKPEVGDIVTGFMLENQGKNSLVKIRQDGLYLELRPGDAPITVGTEFPSVLRTTLYVTFEPENQIQFDANGDRSDIDPAETDPAEPDAVVHHAVLFETFVDLNFDICRM